MNHVTIPKEYRRKMEAFTMWCYRRTQKISRTDSVTNGKVLERRSLWKSIEKRQNFVLFPQKSQRLKSEDLPRRWKEIHTGNNQCLKLVDGEWGTFKGPLY